MHAAGVYEIINTVNGKRYIGSSVCVKTRLGQHSRALKRGRHHSVALQRAWDKYGGSVFKFKPILTCQPSMLLFYEQQLLDKVKPEYNIAIDAQAPTRGRPRSAETRAKLSAKATAQMAVPGAREAASKANKGRKRTAAQIEATAAAHRGKALSPEHRAAISAAQIGNTNGLGRVMSEAHRLSLIGNTRAGGRMHSEETKAKMSAAQSARRQREREALL